VKEGGRWENLCIRGRIILMWITKELDTRTWIRLIWLRIGVRVMEMNLRVSEKRG
jgi:hypothetical protein